MDTAKVTTIQKGDRVMSKRGRGVVVAAFDDGVCWVELDNGEHLVAPVASLTK